MSIHYHEKIKYKVLKSTPKAHLIKVSEINDAPISRFTNLKKYLIPLEIWCPKTWFKKDGVFIKTMGEKNETKKKV